MHEFLDRTWVLDLHNVETEEAREKVLEVAHYSDAQLVVVPAQLEELLKNPDHWELAVLRQFQGLAKFGDRIVACRTSEEIVSEELETHKPIFRLTSVQSTRLLHVALKSITSEEEARQYIGSDASEMLREASEGVLNAEYSKIRSLEAVEMLRGGLSGEEKKRIREKDEAFFASLAAEVAVQAICTVHELTNCNQDQFVDFVSGSYLFRFIWSDLILDFGYVVDGLDKRARADKLLNSRLDQFQVVTGSFCAGSLSCDKAIQSRLQLLRRSIPFATADAMENWEEKHLPNLLDTKERHKQSA